MADMDADGDVDLVSASFHDDKIAWHENTDAKGRFGRQQIITAQADGATSVATADVDGDGDLDVLSASEADHKIAWYDNTDGKGNFGPQQVITVQAMGASSVAAADMDDDGDIDVLSASELDHKIAWYENLSPLVGDSNRDGVFSSSDLILVFQAGEHEDSIAGNSTFEEGDWNRDGEFDSADLVLAFQKGNYVSAAKFAATVGWLWADTNDKNSHRMPRHVILGAANVISDEGCNDELS
jgi:hypothetical protein